MFSVQDICEYRSDFLILISVKNVRQVLVFTRWKSNLLAYAIIDITGEES